MRKKNGLAAALIGLLLSVSLDAGHLYVEPSPSSYRNYVGTLSSTPVNVCSGGCYIYSITLSTAGASGTVSGTDGSGQCSGGCDFFNSVAIAANTTYIMRLDGQLAPGGLNVSATTTVTIHMLWSTLPPGGGLR